MSSADVIRKLQTHFKPSTLFSPWLEAERAERARNYAREAKSQRKRRFNKNPKNMDVKLGHGGTLDPLATGVLVTGVGKGTKQLNEFLGCTKTYEAVVVFGVETDSYDRLGKIVRRAPCEHITREMVEEALGKFRGKIMQRPPIFSALKVKGKKLYEYAREGVVPPIEIQDRPVEVSNLEVLEWYEPGKHDFKYPEEEAPEEEKSVAQELLAKDASLPDGAAETITLESAKRKAPEDDESQPKKQRVEQTSSEPQQEEPKQEEPQQKQELVPEQESKQEPQQEPEKQSEPTPEPAPEPAAAPPQQEPKPEQEKNQPEQQTSPAVKITMTVSSGFYVRSLAHDLGKALNSCGLMAELVRTRQGDFELGPDKILEYKDLDAGEEVWGPKVQKFLEEWEERHA